MKKRALTTLLIVIMAAFSVTGCGSANEQKTSSEGNTVQKEEVAQQPSDNSKEDNSTAKKAPAGITADSPEEFMEKFIRTYYIDRTQDISTIWENCISERSKNTGIISEQDYVNQLKQLLFINKYTDVLAINEGEVQENIYKLNVTYKVLQGNTENSFDEVGYIIDENGNYRLLLGGVTAGVWQDLQTAADALERPVWRTFVPNHENDGVYARNYAVYRSLYPSLKDLFASARK